MTESVREAIGGWWWRNLGNRESSAAKALAARLGRGDVITVLSQPAVHDLARAIGLRDPARLAALVQVLASVRESGGGRFARRIGGPEPALSPLRFDRLLRAEPGADLAAQVRRALPMIDRTCDVGALGADLVFWSDDVRNRWVFEYHRAALPDTLDDNPAEEATA